MSRTDLRSNLLCDRSNLGLYAPYSLFDLPMWGWNVSRNRSPLLR